MIWRVEVKEKEKEGLFDALGQGIQRDIVDLGIQSVPQVQVTQVYVIKGEISAAEIQTIGAQLLADLVTQEYVCEALDRKSGV